MEIKLYGYIFLASHLLSDFAQNFGIFSTLFGVLLPCTLQLQAGFCPCSLGGTDTNRSLKYIG